MSSVCEIFSKNEKKDASSMTRVDALNDFGKMCSRIFSTACSKWWVKVRYYREHISFTFTSKTDNYVIQWPCSRDELSYWLDKMKLDIEPNEVADDVELFSCVYQYNANCFEQDMSKASIDYWDDCGPVIDNAEFIPGASSPTFLSLYEGIIASMKIPLASKYRLSKHNHDSGCNKTTMYISDDLYMYLKRPIYV